jgi:VWFA-related protein
MQRMANLQSHRNVFAEPNELLPPVIEKKKLPAPSDADFSKEPAGGEEGMFTLKKDVEEVTLHLSIVDKQRQRIQGLNNDSFQVFENGRSQKISYFRNEDIPVAVGIVIDNSGSMRGKRSAVNKAVLNFVKASNPDDEVMVVNFNDEFYLDQDFTDSVPLLAAALERTQSAGHTALYDALYASARYMQKKARLEYKALLVVTDGEDTSSSESLEKAIRTLQEGSGISVYTIGLLGDEPGKRARHALEVIAEQTGGSAFFPKNLEEVDAITHQVAHDLRTQYLIGYKPASPQATGEYRAIKVEVNAPGLKDLTVRTRKGYYAGQQQASR